MASVKYRPLDGPSAEQIEIKLPPNRMPMRAASVKKFNQKALFLVLFSIMMVTIFVKFGLISYNEKNYVRVRPPMHPLNESLQLCSESFKDTRLYVNDKPQEFYENWETIYFVTSTYPRPYQIPLLTRLSHTLKLVPKIHWIVADQHHECNRFLNDLLRKFGIPYTLLESFLQTNFYSTKKVVNLKSALKYIRMNNLTKGILYFGDDEYIYDLDFFKEIRSTKKFSMFPTVFSDGLPVATPVVRNRKTVTVLNSWTLKDKLPIDISGFAVNLEYLSLFPNATFSYHYGHEAETFYKMLKVNRKVVEPKANSCTEVLVWKVQNAEQSAFRLPLSGSIKDKRNNLHKLYRNLQDMGITFFSDAHLKINNKFEKVFQEIRQKIENTTVNLVEDNGSDNDENDGDADDDDDDDNDEFDNYNEELSGIPKKATARSYYVGVSKVIDEPSASKDNSAKRTRQQASKHKEIDEKKSPISLSQEESHASFKIALEPMDLTSLQQDKHLPMEASNLPNPPTSAPEDKDKSDVNTKLPQQTPKNETTSSKIGNQ